MGNTPIMRGRPNWEAKSAVGAPASWIASTLGERPPDPGASARGSGRVSVRSESTPVGCGSEVHREIQPNKARLIDAGRLRPRSALQRVIDAVAVDRVVGGRIIGVEQVVEIDADIRARAVEAQNLREPHVELIQSAP